MSSDNLPIVDVNEPITSTIVTMNDSRKGTAIVTNNGNLAGIITDGDLRRAMATDRFTLDLTAGDIMTKSPKICYETEMLADAEEKMRENSISSLVVLSESNKIVGLIQIFNM